MLDPEYSILKQRLERYVAASGKSHKDLNLHTLTVLTEEAITQVSFKLSHGHNVFLSSSLKANTSNAANGL